MKLLLLALLLIPASTAIPGDWESDCERIQPQDKARIYLCDDYLVHIEPKDSDTPRITVRKFL